ncbi:DMT family transporter [Brevibacillus choshinensis]|uniref:DMT family transporter n=1 Tax=Brevibacillus choshinensis TaxID=54911 RepID=UPI002E1BBF51|nr:DMT family transporter [Brevibacillus choshinensis]MED4749858.1 DMT family transporter [Brevibacillus choshinensis]MED4780524.1 DMT family transporter [Brevibacillus choshinensis]
MNRAYVMLIGSVFLWGLTVVPLKWTLETIHPFTLMFLRLLLASLFLLPFAWIRRRRSPESLAPIPWMRIAMLSFTGVAGYFWLNTYGISLTSGVNASIISATLPLFTLLLATFYLKEQIMLTQWMGLTLGIGGVLLITIQPQATGQHSLWGDFLVLASQLIWTVYVVQLKRPRGEEKISSEMFTALSFFLGSLMLLPFAVWEMWHNGLPTVSGKSLLSLLFLVFCCTMLAYLLWNKALETIAAAKAGIYLNAIPLFNVLTAILLLNERMSWRTVLGGIFVLAGVVWAERRKIPRSQVTVKLD